MVREIQMKFHDAFCNSVTNQVFANKRSLNDIIIDFDFEFSKRGAS